MNHFPTNRYSTQELLTLFDSAVFSDASGQCYKTFEVNNDDLEIYFPTEAGTFNNQYIEIARSILSELNRLDNLVQESCESEHIKSNLHVSNFQLYLAYITISEKEVSLRYYGLRVNTEWDAIFRRGDANVWEKVNF